MCAWPCPSPLPGLPSHLGWLQLDQRTWLYPHPPGCVPGHTGRHTHEHTCRFPCTHMNSHLHVSTHSHIRVHTQSSTNTMHRGLHTFTHGHTLTHSTHTYMYTYLRTCTHVFLPPSQLGKLVSALTSGSGRGSLSGHSGPAQAWQPRLATPALKAQTAQGRGTERGVCRWTPPRIYSPLTCLLLTSPGDFSELFAFAQEAEPLPVP